jgi:sulfur carrier protein
VKVRVNGQEREMANGATVAQLLAALDVRAEAVAVAVDRQIVPRSRHHEEVLTEGQQVEIVRAVGGG